MGRDKDLRTEKKRKKGIKIFFKIKKKKFLTKLKKLFCKPTHAHSIFFRGWC